MDVDETLKKAVAYKDEGNTHFKEGKYKKANWSYQCALLHCKGFHGSQRTKTGFEGAVPDVGSSGKARPSLLTNEQEELSLDVEVTTLQNLAVVSLKLQKPEDALKHANNALTLRPEAWKAKLRKAQAYLQLSGPEKAKPLLEEVMGETTDENALKAIKKELKNVMVAAKAEKELQKSIFKGCLSKGL
jgi:tetratricopeptide (TPR) repeat protein